MGQQLFNVSTDDVEGGTVIEPVPMLSPSSTPPAVDIAPASPMSAAAVQAPISAPMSAADLGVTSPRTMLPPPRPPSPAPGGARILEMALLGLAAGLGPRRGAGIAQGIQQAHREVEQQRQLDYRNQQVAYDQLQQDLARQQQEADARRAKFEQNMMLIRNEVKTLPDKATYDQRIEGYSALMQGLGYRIDSTFLRQAVPYVAPSGKKLAGDALAAFYSNPLVKEQLKSDPSAVQKGSIKVDLNGDGITELVPLQRVHEAAGVGMLVDNQGQPVGLAMSTEGSLPQVALRARLATFRADNRREPDPKEIQKIVADVTKANQRPPAAGGGNPDDIEEIVGGIMDGTQPPTLSGLYRNTAAVRAGLHRKGYDLTKATQDWQATTRFMATANGAQQLRMRQAVDNAYHSLDVIDELANKWQGGRFPILNKGRLAAAKQGALGPEAQKIATLLDAQIADVTSELGNVYMGGNSPTDHSLSLAAQNLSSNWSLPQLKAAVDQSRTNLKIRQNSIRNVGPVSVSGGPNQYAAPQEAPSASPAPLVNPFRKR